MLRAIRFHCPGGSTVPAGPTQYRAICVCSAVRVVLFTAPTALTSSKASVKAVDVIDGGGAARNWSGDRIANGSVVASCGVTAEANVGGVGCQSSGPVPGV